jgi:hypothetical protein
MDGCVFVVPLSGAEYRLNNRFCLSVALSTNVTAALNPPTNPIAVAENVKQQTATITSTNSPTGVTGVRSFSGAASAAIFEAV